MINRLFGTLLAFAFVLTPVFGPEAATTACAYPTSTAALLP